jgi:predicted enzyme related to lactoylglutathione lyase
MSTQTQTALGRFVWHDLSSTDLEAAKRFYTQLLGWDVERWKPGELDYDMISVGGQGHGGFGAAPEGHPSAWLGHVVVDGLEGARSRVEGAGGSVLGEPMDVPEVGRILIVRDPQGAVVSAFEPAGEATVPEGVFVWDELYTKDVEGAKGFYGEVFGWAANDMEMGGHTYTLFQAGERSVGGAMQIGEDHQDVPSHWYPYLAAPDIDKAIEQAKELGATTYTDPMDIPDMGRFAVLGDPTGATFGLFQGTTSS